MHYETDGASRKTQRIVALVVALGIFSFGAIRASQKIVQADQVFVPPETTATAQSEVLPFEESVTLQLYGTNNITLGNTPVTLTIKKICPANDPACLPNQQTTYATDSKGQVRIPLSIVRKEPTIAVNGYENTRYFLLNNDQTELTVLSGLPEVKKRFKLTEIVPLALIPTTP